MHFHSLRGTVRSELQEAVLECKQSKVFRHYSSESLKEVYKTWFSYCFRLELTATFTGKDG